MTRVAVCDLGTNATRLLVADVSAGRVAEVDRRLTITRLGENVDRDRTLAPAAIARVEACLEGYAAAASELGARRRVAYATSAVRDARDGEAFLAAVEPRFGFRARLLSGDEEALLTFRGACATHDDTERTLVVDLGGGSTELALGAAGELELHASLDVGCVRLTERHLRSDPSTPAEREALRQDVRRQLAERIPAALRPARGIGVAGTAITLATLHLNLPEEDPRLIHGHRVPSDWIAAESERLASTPVATLAATPGIHPGRAPVIAAGALALAVILEHVGLTQLELSETDILHGAAAALASSAL